jgi:hypothetical protein
MQVAGHVTDDPRGLLVPALVDEADERSGAGRTLQQDRAVVMGQHPGRSVPRPPLQEQPTVLLIASVTFSIAGRLAERTGRRWLVCVTIGAPSGVKLHVLT